MGPSHPRCCVAVVKGRYGILAEHIRDRNAGADSGRQLMWGASQGQAQVLVGCVRQLVLGICRPLVATEGSVAALGVRVLRQGAEAAQQTGEAATRSNTASV